jgi:hypothetical protein
MQMDEIGFARVSESDQRRTVRHALQTQLGPIVLSEGTKDFALPDWPGRLVRTS